MGACVAGCVLWVSTLPVCPELLVPSPAGVVPRPGSCARLRRACVMGRVSQPARAPPQASFNLSPLSWLPFIILVPCACPSRQPRRTREAPAHPTSTASMPSCLFLNEHVGSSSHEPAGYTIVRDRSSSNVRLLLFPGHGGACARTRIYNAAVFSTPRMPLRDTRIPQCCTRLRCAIHVALMLLPARNICPWRV